MNLTVKVPMREFTATLRKYADVTQRDETTILNTKGLYIALDAMRDTPKTDLKSIQKDLGRVTRNTRSITGVYARKRAGTGPLAAMIINARRGRRLGSGSGLYGAAMREAIGKMISGRRSSVAFIKSGWLPAIQRLIPLAEKIGSRRTGSKGVAKRGSDKGYANPARKSWNPRLEIANTASTSRDKKGALIKYGLPSLKKAFANEERSMIAYMEKKLKTSARFLGIRVV